MEGHCDVFLWGYLMYGKDEGDGELCNLYYVCCSQCGGVGENGFEVQNVVLRGVGANSKLSRGWQKINKGVVSYNIWGWMMTTKVICYGRGEWVPTKWVRERQKSNRWRQKKKIKIKTVFVRFFELSLYCFELIIPQVWIVTCISYLPDIRGDSGIKKGFVLVTKVNLLCR